MPRRKSAAQQQTTVGKTCDCSPKRGVFGSIVKAIGAIIAIQGFVIQFGLGGNWDASGMVWALILYIIGFSLMGASKCMGGTCCGSCK